MKKSLILLLITLFALTFVACGKTDTKSNNSIESEKSETKEKNDKKEKDSAKKEDVKDSSELTEKPKEKAKEDASNEKKTETPKKQETTTKPSNTPTTPKNDQPKTETPSNNTTQQEEKLASPGSINGNVYKSNFAGIGFNLPENWVFLTEDELKELNQISTNLMGDAYAAAIANADIFYDMHAMDSYGNSVNIVFEKLSLADALQHTEESIARAAVDPTKDALASMGCTNVTSNLTTITITGKTHHGIAVSAQSNGVTIYEKVAIIKMDRYVVNITVATANIDNTANVLNQFFALN